MVRPFRDSKREIDSTSDHAEVVIWTVDHIPAEVVDQSDVRRQPHFAAHTYLADCLGSAACMLYVKPLRKRRYDNHIPLSAAEYSATTDVRVWRKS